MRQGWRLGCSGKLYLLGGWADTDAQIEWLRERAPHYLTMQSGTLYALAQRVGERGVELKFEGVLSITMDAKGDPP